MSSPRRRPRSSAAAPLDDDDLLAEILLRLPQQPSSLPRASAVCKFWRSLASDPGFSRRFRAHHRRNPPLLGCFVDDFCEVRFQPTLEPPNRVPQARFSFPIAAGNRFWPLGCRHGLVLVSLSLQKASQRKLLVWDPITGDQHLLDIPRGFNIESISAAVLRVPGNILHFQVVLVGNSGIQSTQAVASVYSSVTGVWDKLISTPLPSGDSGSPTTVYEGMPAVMVGGSFYWLLYGSSQEILEFDLDKRSLALIPMPVGNTRDMREGNIWVMPAEGGGLGFLFLRGFCAQLWKMKTDCKGVSSWVLGRSIDLDKLLYFNSEMEIGYPSIVGFAEDNNVVLLWTSVGVFMVQFESLQFKKLFESHEWYCCYPFEGVYTAGKMKRNEVVHDKPAPPVQVSVRFLRSYVQSILTITKEPEKDPLKGKSAMLDCAFSAAPAASSDLVNPPAVWLRPEEGRMKLNTNGSFVLADGTAGSGMILRDHNGNIVFSACRRLYHCHNALESELAAIREGLSLALQWSELPIDIESDCLEAINLLKKGEMGRSANSFMVHEIKILMDQRNSCITHIYRSQNNVSHLLASFGRTTGRTMVWLGSGPDEVVKLCNSAGSSAT